MSLRVQVVEPLGATMDVYTALPTGQRMLVRTEARPLTVGSTQRFAVATHKAHLFESGEQGRNLCVGSAPCAAALTLQITGRSIQS